MLLQAVKKSLRPKQKLIAAVSGGLDSVSLLHALSQLKSQLKLDIMVAHVDHGFRAESSKDLDFVKKLAGSYKFKFVSTKLSKLPKGENLEGWGREKRYDFLISVLKKSGYDAIVTAHQGDDVAETLLMRLVTNKELSSPKKYDPKRKVIRPLLSVERKEVLKYARDNKIRWREDKSNKDEARLRNLVRIKGIPALEKIFGPGIKAALIERAFAVDEDIEALSSEAIEIAASLTGRNRKIPPLGKLKAVLAPLSLGVKWRVIEALLLPYVKFPVGRFHAKRALLVVTGEHLRCELPSKVTLERVKGELVVRRKSL